MKDHNSASSGQKLQETPLKEQTTYRFGNRSFVVAAVFKEESPDTLGSVLLRLMKVENEKM